MATAPRTNGPPRSTSGSTSGVTGARRSGTVLVATGKPAAPRVQPAVAAPPAPSGPLPGWVKGFAIGGVLLALAMPVAVLMSRSMLVQAELVEQSSSTAAMVCTAGDARPYDDSNLVGWLFSGAYFHCGDWETREARQQRARDQAEANYMARERARQLGQKAP